QQERTARAEVGVLVVQQLPVVGREGVGHGEAGAGAGRRQLEDRLGNLGAGGGGLDGERQAVGDGGGRGGGAEGLLQLEREGGAAVAADGPLVVGEDAACLVVSRGGEDRHRILGAGGEPGHGDVVEGGGGRLAVGVRRQPDADVDVAGHVGGVGPGVLPGAGG